MSNTRKLRGRDWEPLSRDLGRVLDGVPEARLRAEMDRAAPGFADQADAAIMATVSAQARLRASASEAPGDYYETDVADAPRDIYHQVHGLFLRVVAELARGERRHCPHVTLRSPAACLAPVFGDWIACLRCSPSYGRPALSEQEEHTCDLCGSFRPGQWMGQLFPAVGFVTLLIGVCPRCRDRIIEAAGTRVEACGE